MTDVDCVLYPGEMKKYRNQLYVILLLICGNRLS